MFHRIWPGVRIFHTAGLRCSQKVDLPKFEEEKIWGNNEDEWGAAGQKIGVRPFLFDKISCFAHNLKFVKI